MPDPPSRSIPAVERSAPHGRRGAAGERAGAWPTAGVAILAAMALGPWTAGGAAAQVPDEPFLPPIAGSWEPVESLGQPRRWLPFLSVGYGVDGREEPAATGGTLALGVYRHLSSPVYGLLGVGAQAYGGQRGDDFDSGVRATIESPAFLVHTGADWNFRARRVDWSVGAAFPPQRGGLLRRGGEIRVAYLPTRSHSVSVAASFPIRQPLAGRTRPRNVDVELPSPPPRSRRPTVEVTPEVAAAVAELEDAMDWVVTKATFFWLTGDESLGYDATVREWREVLAEFQSEMEQREEDPTGVGLHERTVERYHGALDLAFGRALGAPEGEAERIGRPLADRARGMVLEEVVLPYNRTIGQYKQPDRLDGLLARARARWTAWIELDAGSGVDPSRMASAEAVLDTWLALFERHRRRIADLAGDSRMQWLPMALVLRPGEHRTQAQIDGIVDLALGRGFEGGNAVLSINAPQFQRELLRTLHEVESYHVLWIHDYRGLQPWGRMDRTAFEISTEGYLRALLEAVRAYDDTGRFPVFMILLDQHFYELNDGRRWMDLLERPLTHRLRLPPGHEEMRDAVDALQDSLRAAVAGSRRLQAEARSFGGEWVERVVKVHVNITNPSDLSFRSRRLLGPPLGADNLLRDHRKIVIRDVFEDDPAAGEVILAGVGIGDHYASTTWDDRALIVQGPGALEAVAAARQVLVRNRLEGRSLPSPLRERPRAQDHDGRVRELAEAGASARFLQVHNRTGWGDKDATFLQMLLYDLAPPGTLLYVPDSLWTSFPWVAQLVSAALRGCHVYVVGPALANAPSAGYPQMSVMQELLTRLVLVEEVLGARIREGGGDLRVGLFTREVALDDLPAILVELEESLEEHAFLRETFPFDEEMRARLAAAGAVADADEGVGGDVGPESPTLVAQDPFDRVPQLHRKTQWIVNRELVRALSASSGLADLAEASLGAIREGMVRRPESGSLVHQGRMEPTRGLRALHDAVADAVGDPLVYYATGSINKNVRSMALDGEVLGVVAGPWALQAYFDFVLLTGGVTWVRGLEDVERLLPPYSPFQRRIGRWLHRVL